MVSVSGIWWLNVMFVMFGVVVSWFCVVGLKLVLFLMCRYRLFDSIWFS